MSIADHIKTAYQMPEFIVKAYLDDLEDKDLFIRASEGVNHIAWQLGHLIAAEHHLIEQVCPGSMPPLPEGFAEKYSKETASLDDQSAFHSKQEYLDLMSEQRAGTVAALSKLSDEELQAPAPEQLQKLGATVGAIFAAQGTHGTMHAGQWVVVRRQLGKSAIF